MPKRGSNKSRTEVDSARRLSRRRKNSDEPKDSGAGGSNQDDEETTVKEEDLGSPGRTTGPGSPSTNSDKENGGVGAMGRGSRRGHRTVSEGSTKRPRRSENTQEAAAGLLSFVSEGESEALVPPPSPSPSPSPQEKPARKSRRSASNEEKKKSEGYQKRDREENEQPEDEEGGNHVLDNGDRPSPIGPSSPQDKLSRQSRRSASNEEKENIEGYQQIYPKEEENLENEEGSNHVPGNGDGPSPAGPSSPSMASRSGFATEFSERSVNAAGKPAEAGIIRRVYVENFMCHRKLTVDLCRNVNFIHGQNGSVSAYVDFDGD